MPRALYFGCWDRPGHYLFDATGANVWDKPPTLPWNMGHMDGGLLKNGCIPDEWDGTVGWTCGGRASLWFAFVWWDNSIDRRGASNAGFYVEGFAIGQEQQAFEFACKAFPTIVARQRHPLTLRAH